MSTGTALEKPTINGASFRNILNQVKREALFSSRTGAAVDSAIKSTVM